jgi:hypothetical protein
MAQNMVKKDSDVELEELYMILLKKPSKSIQKLSEENIKQVELHDLFKDINPIFFGEAIPVKDAMQRVYTSDIKFRKNFDFSRMF